MPALPGLPHYLIYPFYMRDTERNGRPGLYPVSVTSVIGEAWSAGNSFSAFHCLSQKPQIITINISQAKADKYCIFRTSAGSTKLVEFVLFGQPFFAMSSGGGDAFNHSVSLVVSCDDQEELDRYWNALLEGGGSPEACGWLKDRFGVSWQIVPSDLIPMMSDPDPVKATRVAEAMMKMVKFDAATLRAAYSGTTD